MVSLLGFWLYLLLILLPQMVSLLGLWLYHLLILLPWMVSSPWPLAVSSTFTPSLDGFFCLASGCIICLYSFPGWFLLLGIWLYHLLKLIPWSVSSPWQSGRIFCLYSFLGWFFLLGLWLYHMLIFLPWMVSSPWHLGVSSAADDRARFLLLLLPWMVSSPWHLTVSFAADVYSKISDYRYSFSWTVSSPWHLGVSSAADDTARFLLILLPWMVSLLGIWLYHLPILLPWMVSSPWPLAVSSAYTPSPDGFSPWHLGVSSAADDTARFLLILLPWMVSSPWHLTVSSAADDTARFLLMLLPWMVSSPRHLAVSYAYTSSLDGFFSLASGCIICLYSFPGWFLLLGLWLYHLPIFRPLTVSSSWPLEAVLRPPPVQAIHQPGSLRMQIHSRLEKRKKKLNCLRRFSPSVWQLVGPNLMCFIHLIWPTAKKFS